MKLLWLILILAMTGTATAVPLGFYIGPALLLDVTPSSFAAYSTRKLSTSYAGNCMTVERSSDSTSNSYGFVGGWVDTNSIATFVGAGTGYVMKWYDQSGNSRDATATGTNKAPLIISAGVIQTINSHPTLNSYGSQSLATASVTLGTNITAYSVAQRNWLTAKYAPIIEWGYGASAGIGFLVTQTVNDDWGTNNLVAIGNGYTTGRYPRVILPYSTNYLQGTGAHLLDFELAASGSGIWVDSSNFTQTVHGTNLATVSAALTLSGNTSTGDYWDKNISEIVIYNAAHASGTQSTVRINIDASFGLY